MAFSSTVAFKSVFGNVRVVCLSMIADSGAGDTSASGVAGIGYCFAAQLTPISMVTECANVKINKLAAGTSAAGQVAVTTVTSGDVFYLTIYGRS